jgi:uncharacterized protein YbaR (Trm112 family)
VALDQLLIEVLVDPEDKQPLWYLAGDEVLYNPRLHRRYEIREGIPILLISEGVVVSEEEHAAYEARAGEAIETGTGKSGTGSPTEAGA